MNYLAEIFSKQFDLIAYDGVYQNELETIKVIHNLPARKHERFHRLTLKLLDKLEQPHVKEKCAERSRTLRDQGNFVYKSKTGKNHADQSECLLSACRLYTQAIFEAENALEELCLAFANRGMALQDFGYYEQAYDDCACALEFGYPPKLQHKLIMRQACCALKLGDVKKLKEHLASLEQLQLNSNYSQQLEQLQQELKKLESIAKEDAPPELHKVNEENHKIAIDSGSRGRHMIATRTIPEGDIIFTEQAQCLVPIEQRLICQECAASLLCAPIPCPECHQRVVYCSRRCRELHKRIHSYECEAYRRDLLAMLGVSHLALRSLLTYLPDWLPQLKNGKNAQELWQTLMEMTLNHNNSLDAPQSVQSLAMISHLDKLPADELLYNCLCANLLQVYLFKCTTFYEQLSNCTEDWHLVIGALILRSAGQLLVNAHVSDAITLNCELPLLQPELWQAPYHLRRGFLHKFANTTLQAAINLPYLSLLNHSCAPSIRSKFDGCRVSNFAERTIQAGEEIFNCYTLDYRNSTRAQRQQQLKNIYKFHCSCDKCMRSKPDEDYLRFHRYRCEKPECGKIYVNLNGNENDTICCTICQAPQLLLLELLQRCHEFQARRDAYKAYEQLDNFLLDYNSLKLSLAKELTVACFAAKEDGIELDDVDYKQLSSLIEFQLAATAAQSGTNSLEYIAKLTYLFDLIAWGQYKCSVEQLRQMRGVLNYLPDEMKRVFVSYYNNFIEHSYANSTNKHYNM